MTPLAEPYAVAIASLALYALVTQFLAPMAGMASAKAGLIPGASPPADYASRLYRIHRAYQNSVDNTGTFAAVVTAAVLAGASPVWINLFALIAVIARAAMVVVHIRGIGRPDRGPRSMLYALGSLMTILIGLAALAAAVA